MPLSGVNPDWLYRPGQITTSSVRTPRKPEELGMEDFLQLMMAQMTNQDIFNPVSDTDFIAQMAQFSSLQAMNDLLQHQQASYAVSYVGKNVVVADIVDGRTESFEGVIERVSFHGGQPEFFLQGVNGENGRPRAFALHQIMEIRTVDFQPATERMQNALTHLQDALTTAPVAGATVETITTWKTWIHDLFHKSLRSAVGALNTNAITPEDMSTLIQRMQDLEKAIDEIRVVPATGFPLSAELLTAAGTPINAITAMLPRLR
jgi:flagellar basal-body rod modification protein FlgD